MKLYLLRHGIAANRLTWLGDDAERPLTGIGRRRTKQVAMAVKHWKLSFDRVLTSPALRARQTAAIFTEQLGIRKKLEIDTRLAHGFNIDALRKIASGSGAGDSLLFVGHEPEFSQVAAALIGGGRIVVKKSGFVRIDLTAFPALRGELVWLVAPKLLRGA
ncbi:MAG TPA: phosphohistidine phosphatase SixA [Polyangiaceae bacterium]